MIDATTIQTVTLAGERFVILPEADFLRLTGEPAEPELPAVGAWFAAWHARPARARQMNEMTAGVLSPISPADREILFYRTALARLRRPFIER